MEQIILNLIPKGLPPICHASQYDKGRAIRLVIMDGLQGYYFTDETVELEVRKPDNNVVTAAVDVIQGNSYVDIVTTEQMTACEGDNLCELVIYKGDVRVGSLNFKMRIEVDPLKDGIESETEIHNLTTQIQDINEQIVPDMVAEEVENQYDSQNVIFDDTPTENHGTGYAVTSEGVKNALDGKPDNLSDLGDVNISSPTSNQALVYNPTTQKWENGEVSTVGGLNDLNDVNIDDTSLAQGQELVYNGSEEVFENKTTRVELTQAEYDQLVADDEVLPNVDYYITDAPSMQGSSKDLSYDGGTDSVYDVVEAISSADFTFTPASGVTASSVTACKNDKLCIFSAEIRFTGNANAWTVLGNVDVTPAVNHVVTAGVNTSNGTYLGMVAIEQDGRVRIYPTSAVNNGYVMFSLNFKTT